MRSNKVDNGRKCQIIIPDVFEGVGGIREATPSERSGGDFTHMIAFRPMAPRKSPDKADRAAIDGKTYVLARVKASAVTPGFYTALAKVS